MSRDLPEVGLSEVRLSALPSDRQSNLIAFFRSR